MSAIAINCGTMDEAYKAVVRHVTENGTEVTVRGLPVRESHNVTYSLQDATASRIEFTGEAAHRQAVYDRYVAAELDWYKSGNLAAASAPAKFWQTLADDRGEIVSNYGYMLLHRQRPGQVTEFESVVHAIRADPLTRKAVLHYSTPGNVGTNPSDQPCTLSASVFLRDGKVHMSVLQRSCDLVLGLPYDSAWHCWLISQFGAALSAESGSLTHTLVNAHIYAKDYALARKILS